MQARKAPAMASLENPARTGRESKRAADGYVEEHEQPGSSETRIRAGWRECPGSLMSVGLRGRRTNRRAALAQQHACGSGLSARPKGRPQTDLDLGSEGRCGYS